MVVAATIAPVLNVAYCSFSRSLSLSFLFMFAFVGLTRIDVFPFFSWIPLWVILSLLRQPVPRSSVLSLWQSSGIHPCGDFLFVGTTHQATPHKWHQHFLWFWMAFPRYCVSGSSDVRSADLELLYNLASRPAPYSRQSGQALSKSCLFFPGKTCIRRCMTQLCQPYSGRPLCCNFFVRWAAEQGWTSFEFVFILIVFDRKRHWQLPLQESTTCDAQVTGKFWQVLRPTLPQPALYANSCSWE